MYSGSHCVNSSFAYGAFTLSGRLSQNLSARFVESIMRSEPRGACTTVWPLSISLAATLEIDFSFSSSGYLDVSVHRVPSAWLWIHHAVTEVCSARFPHSDISGSMDICSSPKLFAAYHVFHRLLVPRHPPYALSSITNFAYLAGTRLAYTFIALKALVISDFRSLDLYSWTFVHNLFKLIILTLVITITSDVLIFFLS